jgi:hypothetical protein
MTQVTDGEYRKCGVLKLGMKLFGKYVFRLERILKFVLMKRYTCDGIL